jgi:hypothetical protein
VIESKIHQVVHVTMDGMKLKVPVNHVTTLVLPVKVVLLTVHLVKMDLEEHYNKIIPVHVLTLILQFGIIMMMDLTSYVPLVNVNVLLVIMLLNVLLVTPILDSH